jgi:RNA polymerase sigma-70 factor (ECF subfamily)
LNGPENRNRIISAGIARAVVRKRRTLSEASPVFRMFQANESLLRKFLRRFTASRHDIEDICQETILRAIEVEKTRGVHEPRAFLFAVAKNIVRNQLDKQSRSLIDFIEDFVPEEYISNEPLVEDVLDERQKMIWFAEAVATLPRQCQRVFMMKKVHGCSHKEIASQLGISISTVEKHVAAGLKRCTDYLQKRMEPRANMHTVRGKAAGKP